MKKRMIIVILLLIALFGSLLAWNLLRAHFVKQYFANFTPPPQVISSTLAKSETWQPTIEAIGTLDAFNGVNVTAQQTGMITAIDFHSGDLVQTNAPLFNQNIQVDQEQLKQQQAAYRFAVATYDRARALAKQDFVSQEQLDQDLATMQEDQAAAAQTAVTIAQKTIRAPFAGKVGIRKANLGQYIQPGDNLVTIEQLDPLRLLFTVPQNFVAKLQMGLAVDFTVDAYPQETFHGTLTAVDSEVDQNSRNIMVEATVANPKLELLPGMFASLKIKLAQTENVITIPQTAVSYSLFGNSVYVVEKSTSKDGKPIQIAVNRAVTVGPSRGGEIAILQGLHTGEEVVTSGQLKLENNMPVIVNNDVSITPHPVVEKANEIH